MSGDFFVVRGDFFHYRDPEHEREIHGFATLEAAQDYARRLIRDSIEEMREPGLSPAEVHARYRMFGEYVIVRGLDTAAWEAHCVANPATLPEETDYLSLDPRRGDASPS
jgi:hypothetical protein